jgi:lysophospholipase L1-like esterase
MKEILCFGDSNTYGLIPGTKNRYGRDTRWTGLIEQQLYGKGCRIIEEGLCGRTTVFEDELREGRKGAAFLPTLLESHAPVDRVVLMLGTNDCKTYNHASADRIGKGIEKLIQQIRKADPAIDILLVSPIELGEDVWKPGFDPEFVKVSKQLKQTYLKIAWKYGCDFLAASDVAKPSKADMEHMNEKGHKNLAKAIESFLVEKERNHSNNYVNVV